MLEYIKWFIWYKDIIIQNKDKNCLNLFNFVVWVITRCLNC